MKSNFLLTGALIAVLLLGLLASCKKKENPTVPPDVTENPFSNGGSDRNMIVIISDLHLGGDASYAECNTNRSALVNLLNQIKASPNVKELVIAGDLVDEWFVPATESTYQGLDQTGFAERVASVNQDVFNAFNSIIQEGNIMVTYVPGNHDLTISAANIDHILPGVNQARENVLGLGAYSPAGCPKIVIEHGHRQNFFCSPDPFSNQDVAPGTIMPPGYFFTRLGALTKIQNMPPPADTLPVVVPNASGDNSQTLLYHYWQIWATTIHDFPNSYRFDQDIIITNVNGFTANYSVDDLVPYQTTSGGQINVALYHGIQDNWEARQTYNHVAVHIPAGQAIDSVMSNTFVDYQSYLQYFSNPSSDKRIVVFGHTHVAKISEYQSYDGQKCIYANSGTWIDSNPGQTTMNFVVITPQNSDPASQTFVKLYNFENQVSTLMDNRSVRY